MVTACLVVKWVLSSLIPELQLQVTCAHAALAQVIESALWHKLVSKIRAFFSNPILALGYKEKDLGQTKALAFSWVCRQANTKVSDVTYSTHFRTFYRLIACVNIRTAGHFTWAVTVCVTQLHAASLLTPLLTSLPICPTCYIVSYQYLHLSHL